MPIFGNTPRSKPSLFEEEDERTEFRKGIESGIDQVQALGGGFLALAGSAVGNDDLFFSGLDYYNEQMAEAAESQADVGRIEDIEGFDDFLSYVSYTAGNAIPSLATIVAGGGIGGVAAKAAVKKGIQEKAREYADNRVKDQAADAFKKRVANDYANAALSTVSRRGAQAGALATGSVLGAGESFTRILEENDEEAPGVALAKGLVSGSLDALTPMRALKRILPTKEFESAREAIGAAAGRKTSLYSRVFREAGKQAGVEGVTEAMQEVVQTIASEYVGNNYGDLGNAFNDALFDESKRSAYMNAFAAGLIGGTTFGGVSGLATKDPDATSRVSQEELKDIDERVDQENERLDQLADQARQAEAIPENIENFDGVASARQRQEDVRARVRRQIEARQKAQEAIDKVEAETVEADPQDEDARLLRRSLDGLINREVIYQGEKGVLIKSDEGFFVVTPDEDIFVESGERKSAAQLGITLVDLRETKAEKERLAGLSEERRAAFAAESERLAAAEGAETERRGRLAEQTEAASATIASESAPSIDLEFENDVVFNDEDSSFILRGKKYTYLKANRDGSGVIVSVQAADENGKARTIRNPEVVERVERLRSKAESEEGDGLFPLRQTIVPLDIDQEPRSIEQPEPILGFGGQRQEAENQSGQVNTELGNLRSDKPVSQYNKVQGDLGFSVPVESDGASPLFQVTESQERRIEERIASLNDRAGSEIQQKEGDDTFIAKPFGGAGKLVQMLTAATSQNEDPRNVPVMKSFPPDGVAFSSSPREQLYANTLVELAERGFPPEFLSGVRGAYVKVGHDAYGATFYPASNTISVNDGMLSRASKISRDQGDARGFIHAVAHELFHYADYRNGYTVPTRGKTLPAFKATPVISDAGSIQPMSLDLGSVNQEIVELWQSGDDVIGEQFRYPLSLLGRKLRDANQADSGGEPVQTNKVASWLSQEIFAQLGAIYLSTPRELKKRAPKAYAMMRSIVENPTLTASEVLNGDSDNRSDGTQPDIAEVQGDVRTRAIDRGGEVLDPDGAGQVGGRSGVEGTASIGVEGPPDNQDGFVSGRSVPELDQLEIVDLSELDPQSQKVTASPILYNNESPLDVGAKPTVVSVAKEFDKRVAEAYPDRDLSEQNDENAEIVSDLIAHEALQALNEEGNAGQWYQEKVANAMSLAAQRFPELDTDPNAKFAFTAIMAITSNGASVPENSVNTFSIYEQYRDSKLFPDFGVGKEAQAMKAAFMQLNDLISETGIDSVRAFMDQDVTVKELNDTFGLTVSGELMGTQLKGSAILGPKIGGGFYQNLNGNFDPLTMDRWFMRTYGRLTGSLMKEAERKLPAQIAKFREVALRDDYRKKLKEDGVRRVQLRKDDDYLIEYATKIQSAYAQGGFKVKNTLNKASNTLKNSQGEKQAPQNGTEREYIRKVMQLALDKVNAFNSNDPINMGALQAIIWYPEKELYKLHGVGNAKSEPTDYETEFRKIIEGDEAGPTVSGPIRLAPEPRSGDVQRAVSETDANTEQVERTEVQEPDQEVTPTAQFNEPVSIEAVEVDTTGDTTALNAQIREENKPKFERIKKTFKRLLSPGGLLPKQVFDAKIERDSEMGAVEIDIRQILRQFDDAVKASYGRNLDEVEQQQIHDALTKDFANIDDLGLDSDVKDAVIMMRNYLDNMSVDYAQVLFREAQELAAQGKDEAATAKIDLIQTIVGNAGQYLHRSYRAFDDPNWAKNVPDEVLDAARTYLQENGATNVENVLNQILKEGTAFDSMEGFIRESKLGAKDLSILKRRKDIAPEIRALLGEYIDPKINFTKSATKMSRLLFNDRFLKRVKSEGMGVFLFDDETAPPEAYQKFASDQSDVMAPLNGLRATPELVQAFQDALGKEQMADWYRAIVQVNGLVKYGKTVIAPTTIARNFLSAYMFTLANGHFNLAKSAESIANLQSYFKTKGDKVKYMRRLRELGVVYDTPYAGEMMALLDDSKFEVFMEGKLQGAKNFFDNATRFYQFGDDFWKIVGFENEIDILMDKKGISREEAEPIAAERIRNTYPTYSMVGLGIQKLRRFPLVGTFVSFPAEMIRTSFNMIKYLRRDLNDPEMSSIVPQRIAGLSMVSAGVYALQEALKDMVDVDEDEEEAVRILGPDWSRNSNLAFLGRSEGKLQYVDMSAFDPYNYFKRPINALLRNQPLDDAVYQAAQELLQPFFGQDIAFQNIVEIWQNEKGTGGSVYNEEDSSTEQLEAIVGHIIKGIGPSVVQNINRTYKALESERNAAGRVYKLEDEMAALTGLRVTTLDPKVSLHFKAYDFNQAKRDATRILTSTFRDINDVSDAELKDSFVRASTARKEAFERMIKIVEAARRSGLSRSEIISVLRSNGISKKDAIALEGGVADSWSLSDTTLKNSVEKADLLFGEATGREYERRWSLIQSLMEDE